MVLLVRANTNRGKPDNGNAVVWLEPVSGGGRKFSENGSQPRRRFKIIQQHKHFDPHVLAVPVGSVIDFPNLDPFLHNVFSMFDGKRFDLGLYEAGTTHSVTFDSPGICYIFCNIHPEMSAAVVVTDTPYYAVTRAMGDFAIPNVPAGSYMLNVWHERGKPEKTESYPRPVTVSLENASLGTIRLADAGELLANHKNKYGHDYDAPASPLYK